LAEHLVDQDRPASGSFTDHQCRLDRGIVGAGAEHGREIDGPHQLSIHRDHLGAVCNRDVLPAYVYGPFHVAGGQGEYLRSEADENAIRCQVRQGHPQRYLGAGARLRIDAGVAAEADQVALDDIESDPATRQFGDLFGSRESGEEQQLVDPVLAQLLQFMLRHTSCLECPVTDPHRIDTTAVVTDHKLDPRASGARTQLDQAGTVFPGGNPLVCRLDSVGDCIAHEMHQGIPQLLEHHPVDLCLAADDPQLRHLSRSRARLPKRPPEQGP
jgi:hypothetical protein